MRLMFLSAALCFLLMTGSLCALAEGPVITIQRECEVKGEAFYFGGADHLRFLVRDVGDRAGTSIALHVTRNGHPETHAVFSDSSGRATFTWPGDQPSRYRVRVPDDGPCFLSSPMEIQARMPLVLHAASTEGILRISGTASVTGGDTSVRLTLANRQSVSVPLTEQGRFDWEGVPVFVSRPGEVSIAAEVNGFRESVTLPYACTPRLQLTPVARGMDSATVYCLPLGVNEVFVGRRSDRYPVRLDGRIGSERGWRGSKRNWGFELGGLWYEYPVLAEGDSAISLWWLLLLLLPLIVRRRAIRETPSIRNDSRGKEMRAVPDPAAPPTPATGWVLRDSLSGRCIPLEEMRVVMDRDGKKVGFVEGYVPFTLEAGVQQVLLRSPAQVRAQRFSEENALDPEMQKLILSWSPVLEERLSTPRLHALRALLFGSGGKSV